MLTIRILLALTLTVLLQATISPAAMASGKYLKDEVVVMYRGHTVNGERRAIAARAGAEVVSISPTTGTWRLKASGGASATQVMKNLKSSPDVAYAVLNARARLSQFIPNDPGLGAPTEWQKIQWNFLSGAGVNAPEAWSNLSAARRPGASKVIVAVVDTGVAYRNYKRFRRAPDLTKKQFVRGYDFVDEDPYPLDQNGHGTHVAGTIAQATNNGLGATGLAYGARIMPIRALNSLGFGRADDVAAAIRFSAKKGAQVINLSVEFDPVLSSSQIPQVLAAIRFAHRKGAVLVAASGNFALTRSSMPARAKHVISVGATTENLCLSDYSNEQPSLVAPGGGNDRVVPGDANCTAARVGRGVYQQTFVNNPRKFSLIAEAGTSIASPHVAATAAGIIASGILGKKPKPGLVKQRLKDTARDLGPPGFDRYYGAGLVDAAAATGG